MASEVSHNPELVVIGIATYRAAIGYAEVFSLHIREIQSGELADAEVRLTVLPKDADTLEYLYAHQAPTLVQLAFTALSTGEPYGTAPITGFVDGQRRSWQLNSVREA